MKQKRFTEEQIIKARKKWMVEPKCGTYAVALE
jgi:hypothetical protein